MNFDAEIPQRKDDHIIINQENDVQSDITTGFETFCLRNKALPETNLNDVNTNSIFLGKLLDSPLLISSMTGGSIKGAELNKTFARAANECGIALGVGSQRAAIENPDLSWTFEVRKFAPDTVIFANLGAVQLNYGYGLTECQKAVEMAGADALYLHLNPLQEALQIEGNFKFYGLLRKIESICASLEVPIFVKEVGWGIDAATAQKLINVGVSGIDVAGAGGTSWSKVEMYRQKDVLMTRVCSAFSSWGIPTSKCLIDIKNLKINTPLIASGGLRTGVDCAKALALGANICGMAHPFLLAAQKGEEYLVEMINAIKLELKISMFNLGITQINQFSSELLEIT